MSQKANPTVQAKEDQLKTKQANGPVESPQRDFDPQHALAEPGGAQPDELLNLQRLGGNQAVLRLLQTKLTVGAAGDAYEQEADRMADQVMSMPAPSHDPQSVQRAAPEEEEIQTKPLAASISPMVQTAPEEEEEVQTKPLVQRAAPEEEEVQTKALVQRAAPEEEEIQTKPELQRAGPEDEELPVQGKSLSDPAQSFDAGNDVEDRINASQGGGAPLPDDLRTDMESRFGADFSDVHVHTGGESSQLNRELSAQAFTHGSDIYMGEGKYSPGTQEGQHLLAHELTHVIQQHPGRKLARKAISRKPANLIQRGFFGRLWAWFKHKVDITSHGDYYIWKGKGTSPTKLIISSHGGYDAKDGEVHAPAPIKFFATRNDTTDKQLTDVSNHRGRTETVEQGADVPNYMLSKYQGYHGGDAETYQDVAAFVEANPDYAILSVKGGSEIKYNQILTLMGAYALVLALHCRVDVDERYVALPGFH